MALTGSAKTFSDRAAASYGSVSVRRPGVRILALVRVARGLAGGGKIITQDQDVSVVWA